MVIADQTLDQKRREVHGAEENEGVMGGGERGRSISEAPPETSVKRGNHKPLGQTPSG